MTAPAPPTSTPKKRTGIIKDNQYLNHCAGDDHPECPERLQVLYSMLEEPDMSGRFVEIPARTATQDELLLVHSPQYVKDLKATEGTAFTSLDSERWADKQDLFAVNALQGFIDDPGTMEDAWTKETAVCFWSRIRAYSPLPGSLSGTTASPIGTHSRCSRDGATWSTSLCTRNTAIKA